MQNHLKERNNVSRKDMLALCRAKHVFASAPNMLIHLQMSSFSPSLFQQNDPLRKEESHVPA